MPARRDGDRYKDVIRMTPPLYRNRLSEISFRDDHFPTLQVPHLLQKSVMPIVVYNTVTGEARQAGTCFSISNQGLAITAYHVMEHAFSLASMTVAETAPVQGLRTGAVDAQGEWLISVFYMSEGVQENESDILIGGLCPIADVYGGNYELTDICFIKILLPIHVNEHRQVRMPALRLSPGIPEENEVCFGLGYHVGLWRSTVQENALRVTQTFSAARGSVEKIYFPRRDAAVLTFPSSETSARFEPGMSGGPVIGERGSVIGVITTGMADIDTGSYIGHASLIGPALLIPIECQIGETPARRHLFFEYACAGGAELDETWWNGVRVERDETAVALDFGRNRRTVLMVSGAEM
jgi:hypothetical protein